MFNPYLMNIFNRKKKKDVCIIFKGLTKDVVKLKITGVDNSGKLEYELVLPKHVKSIEELNAIHCVLARAFIEFLPFVRFIDTRAEDTKNTATAVLQAMLNKSGGNV